MSDTPAVLPGWQVGDVVVCDGHAGGPFIRTREDDWVNSNGDRTTLPGCDLILLVRDRQPRR